MLTIIVVPCGLNTTFLDQCFSWWDIRLLWILEEVHFWSAKTSKNWLYTLHIQPWCDLPPNTVAKDHLSFPHHTIVTHQSNVDCMRFHWWGYCFPLPGSFHIAWLTFDMISVQLNNHAMGGWDNRVGLCPTLVWHIKLLWILSFICWLF